MEDNDEEHVGDEKWIVCHILKGLVPKALLTEWAIVFKMPKNVVEHVSRLFCRFIENEGREKIWKPRCKRTVEWEKQNGITEKRKHKPQKENRCPDGNKYTNENPEKTNVCVDI
jgi:hypothetical protein